MDGGLTTFNGQEWETFNFVGETYNCGFEAMTTDNQGRIWIGTPGGGVFMFDGQEWQTIRQSLEPPEEIELCTDASCDSLGCYHRTDTQINDIAVDNQDHVWIATSDGVSSFDGESWTNYGEALPTGSRQVEQLAVSSDDQVWALNSMGELFTLESDGAWTNYSQLFGDDPQYYDGAFSIDPENRLWFSNFYLEPPPR